MMNKTLLGLGIATAVMVPAGLVMAQTADDDTPPVTEPTRDRNRDHQDERGECEFADGEAWEFRTEAGEMLRLRLHNEEHVANENRAQLHEPGEYGPGEARQERIHDGSGEQAGMQGQMGQQGQNRGR